MKPQSGETYTVTEPPTDSACTDQGCPLDRPDMLFPYMDLLGKRVTVTETGHTLNGHAAVKITCGPVEWHPNVIATLTTEQLAALGVIPTPSAGYFIVGRIWAADSADMPVLPAAAVDEFPAETAAQVETPKQRTEIVPVSCLLDPTISSDDKRREGQARRLAKIHGLKLKKMRGRMSAHSTGPYLLVDSRLGLNAVAGDASWRIGVGLDEIETALNKQRERQS
ncbi:hypothetical protein [Streptomyces mirabilis]|uniref:hypothetical protein n=1 Tax=Streptomyces mirabilis TaxID=68239 RepID=UPI0033D983E0